MDDAVLFCVEWKSAHQCQSQVNNPFVVRASNLRPGAMQHQMQHCAREAPFQIDTPVRLPDSITERVPYDSFWRGWREQTERDARTNGNSDLRLCSCQVIKTLWDHRDFDVSVLPNKKVTIVVGQEACSSTKN